MNLIERIALALEPLNIDNFYGWYDKDLNKTHITYKFYQELQDEFGDDDNGSYETYFQLDLWNTDIMEQENLKVQIMKLLKKSGFNFIEANSDYETDTKIYHYATRWLWIDFI